MTIDKAKGIICKPMPKGWKSKHEYKETEQDDEVIRKRKRFLKRIAADRKPYFFIYNYDHLYTRYNRYLAKQENSCYREYGMTFEELLALPERTSEQERFLKNCYEYNPVDSTPCVMNKICWYIENRIRQVDTDQEQYTFDPTLLKSVDHEYTSYRYYQAKPLLEIEYKKYRQGMKELMAQLSAKGIHGSERARILQDYTGSFLLKADVICSDEVLRCDLLIDIAYDSNASKKFVWEVCGSQIIKNLLARKDNTFYYPVKPLIDGEFTFKGETYSMIECRIEPDASGTHQNDSGRVLDVGVGNYTSDVLERGTEDFRGQYERFTTGDYNEWEEEDE